jgi:hypothetical protein
MSTIAEIEIEDVADYYTQRFASVPVKVISAERKGKNVLVLVDHGTDGALLAGDRKPRRWELIYYWLNRDTAALCEVLGSEVTWYKTREVNPNQSLFAQFNCF